MSHPARKLKLGQEMQLAQDHRVMPDEALFLFVAGGKERCGREWEEISLCAKLYTGIANVSSAR